MTKEEAQNCLRLVQALAEGKTIQYYCGGKWCDCEDPNIQNPYAYRVKPEPREFWIIGTTVYHTLIDAQHARGLMTLNEFPTYAIIHVREVL